MDANKDGKAKRKAFIKGKSENSGGLKHTPRVTTRGYWAWLVFFVRARRLYHRERMIVAQGQSTSKETPSCCAAASAV